MFLFQSSSQHVITITHGSKNIFYCLLTHHDTYTITFILSLLIIWYIFLYVTIKFYFVIVYKEWTTFRMTRLYQKCKIKWNKERRICASASPYRSAVLVPSNHMIKSIQFSLFMTRETWTLLSSRHPCTDIQWRWNIPINICNESRQG